jgi:TetR/AcrR family transcriptional regulator, lmrAB and yxaGH operons repressor
MPKPAPDTRTRLLQAMQLSLQTHGYHNTGLTDLLAWADAPKGVLYHHFPDGKAALARAAVERSAAGVLAGVEAMLSSTTDPVTAIVKWFDDAADRLERSSFTRGCPMATVTLETAHDDEALRRVLSDAFGAIELRLRDAFVSRGLRKSEAAARALLIVTSYEGALLLARAHKSAEPLRRTAAVLRALWPARPRA